MDKPTLEALAVLAWEAEKQKCREINRRNLLHWCSREGVPYWLGPLTVNMETAAWDVTLRNAVNHYNSLEKQNANVQQSKK